MAFCSDDNGAQDKATVKLGLIGCGWYGKADLLRLIQISPPSRNMLAGLRSPWLRTTPPPSQLNA